MGYLSTDLHESKEQLKIANESISNQSFFFIVKKSTFDKVHLKARSQKHFK